MWAKVVDNKVEQIILNPVPISVNGVLHPAQILSAWSTKELLDIGVYSLEKKTFDDKFFIKKGTKFIIEKEKVIDPFRTTSVARIGDYPFPTNPMNDRAIGYLLKGKAKSAVTNYGEFIEWDVHPAGLWGDYTYLPDVCFIAGVPGQSYSYKYEWFTADDDASCPVSTNDNILFWCSSDAYNDPGGKANGFPWYSEDGDTNFVNIIFESYRDVNGVLGTQKFRCTYNKT